MSPRAPRPPALPRGEKLAVARDRDPILDALGEGVFTVDRDWRITSFNRAAEQLTGVPRTAAIGQRCREVLRTSICQDACILQEALRTRRRVVDDTVYIVDAWGERIPVQVASALIQDETGEVIGGVETFQDLRQVAELRKQLAGQHTCADIVGRSPAIRRLFDLLPPVAASDATVLIQGPSGSGKELVARALHDLSPRRQQRFVPVNCGALPDALLESELFGYKAGAFTDAKRDKPGRFALAEGGTLFLDEIGDVSRALQVRLLRVLQERSYEPLGGVASVRTDVRVIAATNKDLAELVRAGTLREDLFYRSHVVRLDVPPLAQRREDIPLLVDHLLRQHNSLYSPRITGVSPAALALLAQHDFPGNVRELQNIIAHASVLCRGGLIEPRHLPPELTQAHRHPSRTAGRTTDLKSAERALIEEALNRQQGNRARAAQELGIHPSTLYRKIQRLGLETPVTDGRGQRRAAPSSTGGAPDGILAGRSSPGRSPHG